jgi:hypothetical protein
VKIADSVLRDHAAPVGDVGVIAKRQHPSIGYLGRKQGWGPRGRAIVCFPGLLAVSSKAMDENDTRYSYLQKVIGRRLKYG